MKTRWHAQQRLDQKLNAMMLRSRTVKHVFGTLKKWTSTMRFLTRAQAHVGTEMGLQILANDFKQAMRILGMAKTMQAILVMMALSRDGCRASGWAL